MGKFEKYLIVFSREHLSHMLSKEQIDVFLDSTSLDEQKQTFDQWPLDKLCESYWYV